MKDWGGESRLKVILFLEHIFVVHGGEGHLDIARNWGEGGEESQQMDGYLHPEHLSPISRPYKKGWRGAFAFFTRSLCNFCVRQFLYEIHNLEGILVNTKLFTYSLMLLFVCLFYLVLFLYQQNIT